MYNVNNMTTYESLFILGRQPAIGRAELESVFGSKHLKTVSEAAVACDLPINQASFTRLGGSIRLAKPLLTLPTNKWSNIKQRTSKELPELIGTLPPEGKIKLGLSTYGLQLETRDLLRAGLLILS
jgi:hypothetical protein